MQAIRKSLYQSIFIKFPNSTLIKPKVSWKSNFLQVVVPHCLIGVIIAIFFKIEQKYRCRLTVHSETTYPVSMFYLNQVLYKLHDSIYMRMKKNMQFKKKYAV